MPIFSFKEQTIVFGNKIDMFHHHIWLKVLAEFHQTWTKFIWTLSDNLQLWIVFIVCFVLQGSAYVPRDDLVSLVANEFRVQLSRALAVGISWYFFMLHITNCED